MSQLAFIREHVDLSEYNTMGLSAKARYFVSVKSPEQLKTVLNEPALKTLPKYILGGGSNVLFVDDFDGLIIHVDIKGKEIQQEDDNQVLITAGAGENWHDLVLFCVDKGWGGIENLSLIPGLAGAAPIQNIGAYGVELEEVFEHLKAVDVQTGEEKIFSHSDCNFGYRDSVFKNELQGKYTITQVTLRLQKNPKVNTFYKALSEALVQKGITDPTIRDVSQTVREIRQSKLPDPAKIGNTGSFFKNPVVTEKDFKKIREEYPEVPNYPAGEKIKIPAAWLIEQCGWKGKRFGDAGVHKVHALVIVNYGSATGKEIWELSQKIQESVKEKFSILLVPEVNIVG